MPKILIPTPLRQYTGKQDTVQVKGGTVGEALTELTSTHQDLRRNLGKHSADLQYFVFDLLELNRKDLRDRPLVERKPRCKSCWRITSRR